MRDAPIPPCPQQSTSIVPVNSEERNLAMLAHVLQIFTGFVGPLILYFVKRESRFVRYHSLMALFWQLVVMAFWMVIMVVFFAGIIGSISSMPAQGQNSPMPELLVLVAFFLWGGGLLIGVLSIVLGIVYGIRAYDGKWDGYPVIKGWAAKAAGV
jgi:uncharacterized Tic20 family protein